MSVNQASGLPHGLSAPRMVNGTPNSLLKLFSLLRTRKRDARTDATASFVEVFPTEPVTITMRGWYRSTTARARSASTEATMNLKRFFMQEWMWQTRDQAVLGNSR